jgi:hypothetical protein
MNLSTLRSYLLSQEGEVQDYIRALCSVDSELASTQLSRAFGTLENALVRAREVVNNGLLYLEAQGLFSGEYVFSPGHGPGHFLRDYLNAELLFRRMLENRSSMVSPADFFCGYVGAILHDLGNGLVPRFLESRRVIRHAEAGAVLVQWLAKEHPQWMTADELLLVTISIASHTHYLRPSEILCEDGVSRSCEPYPDTKRKLPLLWIWLCRMVDRLELFGPSMVGRLLLVNVGRQEDFAPQFGFFRVTEADRVDYLRPVIRTPEEIRVAGKGPRLLEQLLSFRNTQVDPTPFNEHDWFVPELMVLRDSEVAAIDRVFQAVRGVGMKRRTRRFFINEMFARLELFLSQNIEPTKLGQVATERVLDMLRRLSADEQLVWANLLRQTFEEYFAWAKLVRGELGEIKNLPGLPEVRLILERPWEDDPITFLILG